jgi:hypothetical protein
VSAVTVSSLITAEPVAAHPWVAAACVELQPRFRNLPVATVRIVPSVAGVAALRSRGKAAVVAVLAGLSPDLPTDPRAWRLVEDLDDVVAAEVDHLNRAHLRSVRLTSDCALDAFLVVPYDLRIFDGHFQSVPIVPGMLQIGWALTLTKCHIAGVGRCRGIVAVKFRRLVRPGMEMRLTLQWLLSKRELRFEFADHEAVISCGRLRMTGRDE